MHKLCVGYAELVACSSCVYVMLKQWHAQIVCRLCYISGMYALCAYSAESVECTNCVHVMLKQWHAQIV
jgi:hypothetical protein